MCGITGFWLSAPRPAADSRALVRTMSDAIAHRGPDSADAWLDEKSGVVLGHRRLAIIDVSPAGAQPMHSASGRFVIVFNGEVYNAEDVRRQLGGQRTWRGHSDTEVMLAAFEQWGVRAAVERFVGMFAFALFDREKRTVCLVRDRVGVKPLYYARTDSGMCFGSELKALRPFPDFDTRINRDAVASYVRFNCVTGTQAIYEGTSRVAPGSMVTFRSASDEAPLVETYWSAADVAQRGLSERFEGATDLQAIDRVEAMLRDAVKLRMVSDVPLGAFLSGGIDSSTVVALMQSLSNTPVHTFSIGNEVAAYDESSAARAVAKHLGTHHTELIVTARDALDVIPSLPTMFDEPFADSSQIPTYLVSKLARQHVTVALSGDGGDEVFGGYARHVWGARAWDALAKLPLLARSTMSKALSLASADRVDAAAQVLASLGVPVRAPGLRVQKLASALGRTTFQSYFDTLASHWQPEDEVLVQARSGASLHDDLPDASSAERMMLWDLQRYLPDDVLTKVDRASMAVSLEAREPLLDHRLIELSWTLPLRFKVRDGTGKWVLRAVLERHVPRELITRSKTGFGVPLRAWLQGPLREWAEALLSEERLRNDGFFDPRIVRQRWAELLGEHRGWEHHLWDILMFNAWLRAA